MTFINLSRGPDGGLYLDSSGQIAFVSDPAEALRQRIESHLRTFLGEIFDDETKGVPYYSEVLVKNPDIASITSLLIYQTSLVEGVSKVNSLSVNFDQKTRDFAVSFEVIAVDSTIVAGVI